ncbi:hypothetical protein R2F61_05715 [Mollicutes bacterium LVI A0078]|nr:hypothetical protein RZE84_05720 [Mollicutes bacterium LVI A0075]WOO90227.1 hypothetical protein R2F61_05715 [Mollicutes bacterium LVI A0078]
MKKKVALISAIVVSIILIIAIVPKQMRTINDPWSSTSWTVYVAGWQIKVIFLIAVIGLAIYLLKKK